MNKPIKIIFINSILIFFIILVFELTLGHWLEKDHFGYNMRGKRLQMINFSIDKENFKKEWTYRRDYYGFREEFDFADKYDLSKIDVVFTGGSTGAEMILPYEETIVGNLNKFLNDSNLDIKIFNASLDGKSLIGKINDFNQWFNKLENFNPKIMIFYMGLTDRSIPEKRFHDNNEVLSNKDLIINTISQRSFIWEKLKIIKNIYFDKNQDGYAFFDKEIKKENKFVSYDEAKKSYINLNEVENEVLTNYKNNLQKLKKILNEKNITPIFITQVRYDGNGERILFYLNEELKIFSILNNFRVIPLDEFIDEDIRHLFIDEVHTNKEGSLYISKKIYPSLKKIFETDFLNAY